MRLLTWIGISAGIAGAAWWFGRSRVPSALFRLTHLGLHDGTKPITLADAVKRAHDAGGVASLTVDTDAYEGDFKAIEALFNREKITLKVTLPASPLLPYTTTPETR